MHLIRRFEELALEFGTEGLIEGSMHPCLGQEAIPVGAVAALREEDRILTTYRGHGWAIARGVPVTELLAELAQREGGINGGRGGSPHFFAPRWGLLGENSIVGAGVPIGAGVAVAASLTGSERVTLTSIGDGAMAQGSVHEGILFAAARDLPLIVLIESNGWSEMTRTSTLLRIERLIERAAAYGIPGISVDGTDPIAVRDSIAEAAEMARLGKGPVLVEAATLRLGGHYNRDIEHYRPKAEREEVKREDPVALLRQALVEAGEGEAVERIEAEVEESIRGADAAVRAMPAPDPSTASSDVYAAVETGATVGPEPVPGEEMTYIKAVNAALREALAADAKVIVYGEDVGAAGGIFGATRGLQEEFGAERVFDTPIAESAILGSAVGASMEGVRPVVEIMWADFLLVALDQLVNQAANVRYVTRSELSAPIVVRTQQGVTPGSCAQHSQSLEAFLAHVPGLKVGLAATAADAHQMLRAAVADPDPVILIESRGLYQTKGSVDLSAPVPPIGGGRIHREGGDLTIIAWGGIVPVVLTAADELAERGVESSVLDLRWLRPLDEEAIGRVVRGGGGHVLVVHEANITGGFGAEIAARVQEHHFDYLDQPVKRLGVPDSRIPSAPALQQVLIPDASKIVEAAMSLLGRADPAAV
jgi:2-oxoisovalerate dehydrogenase E1 component